MADSLFSFVASSVKYESDKAFLFIIGGDEVWMPKSQIRECDISKDGIDQEVKVTEWIAQQKGMIDESGNPVATEKKGDDIVDDDIPF